jgi:hypothetical protein
VFHCGLLSLNSCQAPYPEDADSLIVLSRYVVKNEGCFTGQLASIKGILHQEKDINISRVRLGGEILSNVVDWSFTGGVYQLGRVEQNIL